VLVVVGVGDNPGVAVILEVGVIVGVTVGVVVFVVVTDGDKPGVKVTDGVTVGLTWLLVGVGVEYGAVTQILSLGLGVLVGVGDGT